MDNDWNLVYPKEASHLDGIDDELLPLINDHWAQFPPQHPMVNVCGGLLYLTLSMINYVGNGIVLYVFLKVIHFESRTYTNNATKQRIFTLSNL